MLFFLLPILLGQLVGETKDDNDLYIMTKIVMRIEMAVSKELWGERIKT